MGRTKYLNRCKNNGTRWFDLFCSHHNLQPIVYLFSLITIIGLAGGIYQDIWKPIKTSIEISGDSEFNEISLKDPSPKMISYSFRIEHSKFLAECPAISYKNKYIIIEFEIFEDIIPNPELIWIRTVQKEKSESPDVIMSNGIVLSDMGFSPKKGMQKIKIPNEFKIGHCQLTIGVVEKNFSGHSNKPMCYIQKCNYYLQ